MSNPTWLSPRQSDDPGHVPARMETMASIATPSISVSTQQSPKKFAPVVAPKPKFNPYKQNGQPMGQVATESEFPPPPPPVEGLSPMSTFPGGFPPPPTLLPDQYETSASLNVQTGKKTLDERRSSLDAEIDSLTSILADLESSSPYQPRPRQSHGVTSTSSSSSPQTPITTASHSPVIGHQRMIIPSQPLLTATKKAAAKPHAAQAIAMAPKTQPQPIPASYTTASTPARPAFNVQVKSAQPNPNFMPQGLHQPGLDPATSQYQQYNLQPTRFPETAPPVQTYTQQPRSVDHGYRAQPTQYADPGYTYNPSPNRYQDHRSVAPAPTYGVGYAGDPAYGAPNTWRPEAPYTHNAPGSSPSAYHQPAPNKKAYITDQAPGPAAPLQQPKNVYQSPTPAPVPAPAPAPVPAPISTPAPTVSAAGVRPEDELERLTKRMLYDMENPPSDDYFGCCTRCGESVVGDGAGCTAMDQVFHVDCFTCMTCGHKLRGQPFYAVEKKSYCEACYINTLEKCSVCSKPIMERILRATGKAYHPQCFTCVMCHRSLDGIPFTVDASNQIHCIEDFHKKFAPRCSVCNEAIMPAEGQEETVRIVALDRDFHVQCYRCEDCSILLSDGDNQGCYPLDGHIYCKNCNATRIQALTAKSTTDL
ncbi:lipoma-preferred partner isoform X1 [Stegostoma tigrinum]|uniref:lipoma-preferred partner isoform X1 n=2 Tax=Stegostoma tigrinum TaxID=3053191 RepID=UPI00202ADBAA|nr:lipoma-preferred partner isoform X1 [Stegostoma tigrinum]XP_048398803.1 lipoma-preferred partner isoform X1 [Stegostoma tigrinum]XP_048398804.1 lipoma-preferred partner isoform X1 [Stegostoma tigrinum]XP_048398806.1 lipoma-preferred partner isoform X1 [Stegostoma tigrinum]